MNEPEITTLDLRRASDEDLIRFIFDHPATEERGDDWYWSEAWANTVLVTDPAHIVGFLTRLFRAPEPLLHRFTPAQIDQGIWMMFCIWGAEHFRHPLWDTSVAWNEREACIAAIPDLYQKLLIPPLSGFDTPLGGWFMLPDFLTPMYNPELLTGEDEDGCRVQEALLNAYLRMLNSGNSMQELAAVHGIFHLPHPEGPSHVRAWMDAHPALDAEVRDYAEQALKDGAVP